MSASPISCPIVVLAGRAYPVFSREDAVAWGPCTTGLLTVRERPGGHFFIDTSLAQVVDDLQSDVDQAL